MILAASELLMYLFSAWRLAPTGSVEVSGSGSMEQL